MLVKEDFISHSGNKLEWKIECDDFTSSDWEAAAYIISRKFSFYRVLGIPRGGLKLSVPLVKYIDPRLGKNYLIVDDVFTTGTSMAMARKDVISKEIPILNIRGVVLFSRGVCPQWITPLFQLGEKFHE